MNCMHVRNRLSELLYEDLAPSEREQLNDHLAQCPECRNELVSLQEVRRALDAVPAPEVSVNLSALYRRVADVRVQAGRRWRRAALAAAGLAAALIIGLALRLEIRFDRNQLVIRWGSSPSALEPPVDSKPEVKLTGHDLPPPASEAELLPLRGVIYALAEDMDKLTREVEARDQRQQQTAARLQEQLVQLRIAIQRQMALSLADSSKKGDDR